MFSEAVARDCAEKFNKARRGSHRRLANQACWRARGHGELTFPYRVIWTHETIGASSCYRDKYEVVYPASTVAIGNTDFNIGVFLMTLIVSKALKLSIIKNFKFQATLYGSDTFISYPHSTIRSPMSLKGLFQNSGHVRNV